MMKRLAYVLLGMAALAVWPAHAQSPREQLNQLVTQLQTNSGDTALRERIIKLAQEIKPPPAVPEEAERRMARGSAAFKSAKNENDFKDAVREFEQASIAAPWFGDIYYNLGLAQDKAGDYASAIRSLKLAMAAAPDSRETKTLLYEVEYRQEKVNSPEAQAAKKREQEEVLLRSIDGALFGTEFHDARGTLTATFTVEIRGKQATWTTASPITREHDTYSCMLDGRGCTTSLAGGYKTSLEISTDGRQATTRTYFPNGNLGQTIVHQRRR